MGPYLPAQNYLDIGKISVAARNLSTRGVPRPCLRGGGRGGVPIEGARILTVYTPSSDGTGVTERNTSLKSVSDDSVQNSEAKLQNFEARKRRLKPSH